MNWIPFSERKPEAKPVRELLCKLTNGTHHVVWSGGSGWMLENNVVEWSEIEPPPRPDPREGWHEIVRDPPPKPDPFEEVWDKAYPGWVGTVTKVQARFFWDAAIKWKEGQK